jgi:hypothetical protein
MLILANSFPTKAAVVIASPYFEADVLISSTSFCASLANELSL